MEGTIFEFLFVCHSRNSSDVTLAFEDAQVIPPLSRKEFDDTDYTDVTDDTYDMDDTDDTLMSWKSPLMSLKSHLMSWKSDELDVF